MQTKIFPDLVGVKWAEVNLDALAREEFMGESNPLIDPRQCDDWVQVIAQRQGVDYTYGGYLEDRSHLWRKHYLPPGQQLHLGVDYNVPAGTRVAVLADAEVFYVGHDCSFGGWGGVLIFKLTKPPVAGADYLYYGHLAWNGLPTVGQKVKAGDMIGRIGKPHENGMWFPHLHVQLVSGQRMKMTGSNPLLVDGYMSPPVPTEDFPDPRPLIIL